jgi:hypothetical protein
MPSLKEHGMMNRRELLVAAASAALAATVPVSAQAASPLRQFRPKGSGKVGHGALDAVLKAHVRVDPAGYATVDYAGLRGRRGELTAYLAAMQAVDPTALSRREAHAFWINMYNAKTLDVILEHYPVRSIRDINLGGGFFGRGPWSKKMITASGTELSLDDVEHRIVRALFNDPLSHYALNCASVSCPNLMPRAYTAGNLDEQMRESARLYVNHPRGVSISDGRITASKIYSWYADDFGGKGALKAHWTEFATPELAAQIEPAKLGDFVYDWSLNGA